MLSIVRSPQPETQRMVIKDPVKSTHHYGFNVPPQMSHWFSLPFDGFHAVNWWSFLTWGTPCHHPFLMGCSSINHPAIGVPPIYENPHIWISKQFHSSSHRTQPDKALRCTKQIHVYHTMYQYLDRCLFDSMNQSGQSLYNMFQTI